MSVWDQRHWTPKARKRRERRKSRAGWDKYTTKKYARRHTPQALKKRKATRVVTKYAGPDPKYLPPTIAQLRTAWPTLTEKERKEYAPKILRRSLRTVYKGSERGREKPPPAFLRKYDPKTYDEILSKLPTFQENAAAQAATDEAFNNDLGRAVEFGLAVLPIGKAAQLGYKGAKAGTAAIKGRRATVASKPVAATSKARTAARASKAAGATQKAQKGTRVGRAVKASKPVQAGRAAKTTVATSKVGRGAKAVSKSKVGRATGATARGTGKALKTGYRYGPVRPRNVPFYAAGGTGLGVAAQTPAVLATGDPSKFLKPITEGTGALGGLVDKVRGGLDDFGVLGNAVGDIVELPTAVIPSTYLLGKALYNSAVNNDDTELDAQLKSLMEESFVVGAAKGLTGGGWEQAKKALVEHPIYSALEASGAKAVAGRGAGATMRSGALRPAAQKAASTERAPLEIGGGLAPLNRGGYSKDVLNKAAQTSRLRIPGTNKMGDKARAKRTGDKNRATPEEVVKVLNERVDRVKAGDEGKRREDRSEIDRLADEADPRSKKARKVVNRANSDGAHLATISILRSTRSFGDDIAHFARILDKSYAKLQKDAQSPDVAKAGSAQIKMEANREMAASLPNIAKHGDPERIFESASKVTPTLKEIDAALDRLGLLPERQAKQSSMIPAARIHLGAKMARPNEVKAEIASIKERLKTAEGKEAQALKKRKKQLERQGKQLVDREGNALPPERLEAELKKMGVEETGFVTMRPRQTERAAGYVPSSERPGLEKGIRTGKAAEEGSFELGFDAVRKQMRKAQGKVSAAEAYDGNIREFGVGPQFNDARVGRDAEAHPEKYGITPPVGQNLKLIRTAPFAATTREIKRANELQTKDAATHETVIPDEDLGLAETRDMAGVWEEATNLLGEGPFRLIPETTFLRLAEHYKPQSPGFKAVQEANQWFKSTVLATSPKWIMGNIFDINFRSGMSGNLPFGGGGRKRRIADRTIEAAYKKDPVTARRNASMALAGGHYSSRMDIHRTPEDYPNTKYGTLRRMGRGLGELPVGKQVYGAWRFTRDHVFEANQRLVEMPTNKQLLGDALIRELKPELTGRMKLGMKIADDIIDDMAEGFLNTENVIRLAKVVEESTGQWTGNSPTARTILSTYAPFGMWTRAATKYVLVTLPAHHPIKTAIMANIEQMTADERIAMGLSFFSDRPATDNLRGAIPLSDGGVMPFSNYSSVGYFSDLPGGIAQSVLPQIGGATKALTGLDPFGEPLENEDETPLTLPQRVLAATQALAGSFIPGVGKVKQISEADSLAEGLKKQFPFTNANNMDPDLYQNYIRNLGGMKNILVPVEGSTVDELDEGSSSSSSEPSLPSWYGSGESSSSSSSSEPTLPSWYGG